MRVRILKRRSRLRWLETMLLIVGLAAVDYYIWVNVDATLSQVYAEWKFDRSLHGESSSISQFIVDDKGLRRIFGLGTASEGAPAANGDAVPRTDAPATPATRPRHQHGPDDVIGRLEIPRLDIRVMVREGDGDTTLRHAVGHISSTAYPGELGNVALAAHRDTYFRPLRNIRKNDRILLSTVDGTYEYLVQSTRIVSPSDVSVLKASAPRELTLVTCYPFYYIGSAPRRFIVHATQVGANTRPPQPKES